MQKGIGDNMKSQNIKDSRELLERALRQLPTDSHAVTNLRVAIRRAINEAYAVEHKQAKKSDGDTMNAHEKWQLDLKTSTLVSPQQQKHAVSFLDQMIKEQEKIIDDLNKKKAINANQDVEPLLD